MSYTRLTVYTYAKVIRNLSSSASLGDQFHTTWFPETQVEREGGTFAHQIDPYVKECATYSSLAGNGWVAGGCWDYH